MARSPLHLPGPRRLAAAAALALLLGAGTFGAFGLAAASGEPATSSDMAPRIGDVVVYGLPKEAFDPNGTVPEGYYSMQVLVTGASYRHNSAGEPRWSLATAVAGNYLPSLSLVRGEVAIDMAGRGPLEHVHAYAGDRPAEGNEAATAYRSATVDRTVEARLPCRIAPMPPATDVPQAETEPCFGVPAEAREGPRVRWVQEPGSMTELRGRLRGGVLFPELRIERTPGIPYPTAFEDLTGEHFGGPVGHRVLLLRWERGTTPLPEAGAPPAPLPPPVPLAVDRLGMPQSTDVGLGFSLHEAVQAALDAEDQPLAEYLREHPEAFLQYARTESGWEHDMPTRTWEFAFSEGSAALGLRVTRQEQAQLTAFGGPLPRVPTVDGGPGALRYAGVARHTFEPWRGSLTTVPAGAAQGLVAAPLSDAVAFGHLVFPDAPANATAYVEYKVVCGEPCLAADAVVLAGWTADTVRFGSGVGGDAQNGYERIEVAAAELTGGSWTGSARTAAGFGRGAASVPPLEAASVPVASAAAWRPTAAQAAGAGVAALAVAAAYYLWPVAKAGFIGLFSRIEAPAALDHPRRRLLLEAVRAQPGIHVMALSRLCGMSRRNTTHHLRVLQQVGMVSVRSAGKYACCFATGAADRHAMAAAGLLKSRVASGILRAARDRPGVAPGLVARELGVAPSAVSYHLRRLEGAGLVESSGGIRATQAGTAAAPA